MGGRQWKKAEREGGRVDLSTAVRSGAAKRLRSPLNLSSDVLIFYDNCDP